MSATQTLADRLSAKTSRPSCNQDDAGLDRNPIWSVGDKRITALMPVDTAEAQKSSPNRRNAHRPHSRSRRFTTICITYDLINVAVWVCGRIGVEESK